MATTTVNPLPASVKVADFVMCCWGADKCGNCFRKIAKNVAGQLLQKYNQAEMRFVVRSQQLYRTAACVGRRCFLRDAGPPGGACVFVTRPCDV